MHAGLAAEQSRRVQSGTLMENQLAEKWLLCSSTTIPSKRLQSISKRDGRSWEPALVLQLPQIKQLGCRNRGEALWILLASRTGEEKKPWLISIVIHSCVEAQRSRPLVQDALNKQIEKRERKKGTHPLRNEDIIMSFQFRLDLLCYRLPLLTMAFCNKLSTYLTNNSQLISTSLPFLT